MMLKQGLIALATTITGCAAPQPTAAPPPRPLRLSDWLLGGLVLGEVALVSYAKVRSRFNKIKS